ncbi:hypothetical protein TVAG_058790 [Trichomonas vaginalis G3]|uniref:Uncharacterized protein n=1 Tax=Trichomonas vaginalis (strain ATCC PRA-98 / G3) TaxID=412133 RepID=A2FJZ3_TRIV3|nr:chromatin organization [Trichomonas vaginalis G3]EAX94789.1 hypothetical protein TVAG_058790 [Trichomonas vaginalis G3]KAI5518429.1 chromatin organization [Trichomonas vaginalis G3]|eukprot:XP_001307719.1 hypothetical protein [Trichomonas vaginalis G3]
MSDIVRDFFEWRYHVHEFYDGIIVHAQQSRPISLNFTSNSNFISDSAYYGLVMAHPGDQNSSLSLWTACFPNKNSPEFHPTKPNQEWGKLHQKRIIPLEGKVLCCTTDRAGNIFVGTNQSISILTETETYSKQVSSPAYFTHSSPKTPFNTLFCFEDNTVCQFDPHNSSLTQILALDRPVLDISINQNDTNQIFIAQGRKSAIFLDLRDPNSQQTLKFGSGITSIQFSNHHPFLFVTGSSTGIISMYDIRNPGTPFTNVHAHDSSVTSLKWSPIEPDIIASASQDTAITIWSFRNTTTAEIPTVFAHNGHVAAITAFDWCPDSPWTLASVSEDALLEVWTIAPSQIEEFV